MKLHIFSLEVLKKILRDNDDGYFYSEDFLSLNKTVRLEREVAGVFRKAKFLSVEDVREKMPYVPKGKILAVLSDTKKYLPTTAGKYIPISEINFDMDEIQAAEQQIFSAIDANGCAAPEDYSLSSNIALNPALAEKTLRSVIYDKFFSNEFVKRGKKLFKKGVVKKRGTGTASRLKEFIADHDELSVEELFNFAKRMNREQNTALCAAHETMTRADKDWFVKDSLIDFDIAGVDEALAPFVQNKIISLRSVTSFTGFPPVAGYSWNLFLLESFLRKYSRKYVYVSATVNNNNIGAIYPASMKLEDYLEVQARVVVQERLSLEKHIVENFLINRGFRVKRLVKVTEDIIIRAREIIDERHLNVHLLF